MSDATKLLRDRLQIALGALEFSILSGRPLRVQDILFMHGLQKYCPARHPLAAPQGDCSNPASFVAWLDFFAKLDVCFKTPNTVFSSKNPCRHKDATADLVDGFSAFTVLVTKGPQYQYLGSSVYVFPRVVQTKTSYAQWGKVVQAGQSLSWSARFLRKLGLAKYAGGMRVAAYCKRREEESWRVPSDVMPNPEAAPLTPELLSDTYFGRGEGPLNPLQVRSRSLTQAEVDTLPPTVHDIAYALDLDVLEALCARSGVSYDVLRMQLDLVNEAREMHCAMKCPHHLETRYVNGLWEQVNQVNALRHVCSPRTFAELPGGLELPLACGDSTMYLTQIASIASALL